MPEATIGDRLAELREARGLSLREFARGLEEVAGHSVSYTTVRKYERSRSVPSDYLMSVTRTFGVDPLWLLTGESEEEDARPAAPGLRLTLDRIRRQLDALEADAGTGRVDVPGVEQAWRRFRDGQDPRHPLRDGILRSWRRSREAGVEPEPGEVPVRRVADEELEEHRRASAAVVEAAVPHVEWLSEVVEPVPHAVYLTCRHGIVLHAVGADQETLEEQGLAPGFDWSESEAGTNGAGTALATGRPVVVVGPEHYARSFHDFVCCGVPILGPDGSPAGALDLSTALEHGSPERLSLVFYAARAVAADLAGREAEATTAGRGG